LPRLAGEEEKGGSRFLPSMQLPGCAIRKDVLGNGGAEGEEEAGTEAVIA